MSLGKSKFLFLHLLIGINWSIAQKPFTDITEQAGIDHVFKVYEGTFGGGATVFDFNTDGYEDLFITSGTGEDVLYKNNRDGTFSNVYNNSGLEVTRKFVTQGAVSADVNRDGYRDLFVTTITTTDSSQVIPRAMNLLFLNKGDGTFKDVTKEYQLDELNSFSTGASFGDVNSDGFPDLYVGNYFQEFEGKLGILKDETIVNANRTAKGYLLINKEGKYFENQFENYDLTHRGFGFGALFTDYDNDGDQDMLVNHDFGYKAPPSLLLQNRYPWRSFRKKGKEKNMDLKMNAMGSAVGDYNNDGLLDYYITNIKFNWFMQNQGQGLPFVNRSKELGTHFLAISWGANFADFDNDGDLDLYVSNGDLNPNCTPIGNFYFENDGNRFVKKEQIMGLADYGIGRGSVVFDIENDGDMDILVVNQKPINKYPTTSKTKLFRNDMAQGNWLKIALEALESEKNGIGSRIEVAADGIHMTREIDGGGSSHLSQNSVIAHFGLGTTTVVDSVIISWVGGKKQIVLNQSVNKLLTIREVKKRFNYWWIIALIVILAVSVLVYPKVKNLF